jgi:hypothetical protein
VPSLDEKVLTILAEILFGEFRPIWDRARLLFPECVGFRQERCEPNSELLKIYRRGVANAGKGPPNLGRVREEPFRLSTACSSFLGCQLCQKWTVVTQSDEALPLRPGAADAPECPSGSRHGCARLCCRQSAGATAFNWPR